MTNRQRNERPFRQGIGKGDKQDGDASVWGRMIPAFVSKRIPRRTPISSLNLLDKPTQAVVSILGVAFALLLIFMQLGFRGAVANTATIVSVDWILMWSCVRRVSSSV